SSSPLHSLCSFPTRRSSDLQTLVAFFHARERDAQLPGSLLDSSVVLRLVKQLHVQLIELEVGCAGVAQPCVPPLQQLHGKRAHRSEEHTSELQSLRHLVCRL